MNVFEKLIKYISLFLYVVINFIVMIVQSLIISYSYFKIGLIEGILYQPFIFSISLLIIKFLIGSFYNIQETILPYFLIFLSVLMLILVISINAFIELVYCFKHEHDRYDNLFKVQRVIYDKSLLVISLIALWIAYDNTIDDRTANLELFVFNIIFFFCVITTDLYHFLIHSHNKVEKLYENIMKKKEELF